MPMFDQSKTVSETKLKNRESKSQLFKVFRKFKATLNTEKSKKIIGLVTNKKYKSFLVVQNFKTDLKSAENIF